MEPKKRILLFIANNPGILTEEITLGIKRNSLGLHLRNLTDKGLLIKTQDNRWQVSNNYVMEKTVHKLSPMDIAEKHIREMIFCSDKR
jgi:predicted transcriptional regulator